MIKYRYALDNKNNLIDILNLERSQLTKFSKFYSLDFGQELIPRLGSKRRKHFAHKPEFEILGSCETYLHALGKKIFYNDYIECLNSNTPYFIEYKKPKFCNRLSMKYGIYCQLQEETGKFDLTKYFTTILIEKKDGNFIPDLLLLNPKTNEKIYIEIAVTHYSSNEKKVSGKRMLEFSIMSEDDAQRIVEFKNGDKEVKVEYLNFKKKEIVNTYCSVGNCKKLFNYFTVSQKGKCHLSILTETEIESVFQKYNSNSIFRIFELSNDFGNEDYHCDSRRMRNLFIHYVARAYGENKNLKNCFICRYHAKNNSWDYEDGKSIFCKFQKITCNSNQAVDCTYFKFEYLDNNAVSAYFKKY